MHASGWKTVFGILAMMGLGMVPQVGKPVPKDAIYRPPPLDTWIFGPGRWQAHHPVAFRVVTRDVRENQPVRAAVRVTLAPVDAPSSAHVTIFQGSTGPRGMTTVRFTAPRQPGTYRLRIQVHAPIGTDIVERDITVEERARILLSTDKPIYQPGQRVHIRALVLHAADRTPLGNRVLVVDVQDPKGNRVFRRVQHTSEHGIVAVTFPIADAVHLGMYTVRARVVPSTDPATWQRTLAETERSFRVDRYVLPRFKVELTTDRTFYLPGDVLNGTVSARYFFGKPVDRGRVTVTLQTFAAGWQTIAELTGTLNAEGTWTFSTALPEHFVGLPLEQGRALLRINAEVTDRADHTEHVAITRPVHAQPIEVFVIPERPDLPTGLPVRVYVVTQYPDGSPARCRVELQGRDASDRVVFTAMVHTDDIGWGETEIRIPPGRIFTDATVPSRKREIPFGPPRGSAPEGRSIRVDIHAVSDTGQEVRTTRSLTVRPDRESILLRVDRVTARVGDVIQMTVRVSGSATGSSGVAFIDAIVHGQTVLTRTVRLRNGAARIRWSLTPELTGTVTFHAYRVTSTGNIVRDTRTVIVDPANELWIHVTTDRTTYRPGETARVRFTVEDTDSRPVQAVLGLTVVDESVYALAEAYPGLERLYFLLEEALLHPKVEIHGWDLTKALLQRERPGQPQRLERRERIARVLLAATRLQPRHRIEIRTYAKKVQNVIRNWRRAVRKIAERFRKALNVYLRVHPGQYPEDNPVRVLIRENVLFRRDLQDPLGHMVRVRTLGLGEFRVYVLTAAGPDERIHTEDDCIVFVSTRGVSRVYVRREVPDLEMRLRTDWALWETGLLVEERVLFRALPAPPPAAKVPDVSAPPAATAAPGAVRVRQFFPETLFVQPVLMTDTRGVARLQLPLADSITTWRLTALAHTRNGKLGSTTATIRVFQPFFVDIDLPVALTQGDEIAVPVAVYNYLKRPLTVRLRIDPGEGFALLDTSERTVRMQPNEVTSVRFRLRAQALGEHALTVRADGEHVRDAVRRSVTIVPDGKAYWWTTSDRLSGGTARTFRFAVPSEAIPGATRWIVRVLPSALTQIVEGLDHLLRMPFGCFEQTSSVTYPNVLILTYLRHTGRVRPEVEMKAREYITIGYQRLLTFEVDGGGFSWFGNPPAHPVLTAYGLIEFADMARVHDVDVAMVHRTARWLVGRQQPDGTWAPDPHGIREGIIDRQTDVLRTTAYIAWALTEAARMESVADTVRPSVRRTVRYLVDHAGETDDPYALAVMLNALIGARTLRVNVSDRVIDSVAGILVRQAVRADDQAYWKSRSPTPFYGRAESGDLETTALAAYALMRHGGYADVVRGALLYLIRRKHPQGGWATTQATVWALKALVTAAMAGTGRVQGTVTVRVGTTTVASWRVTPENVDVLRQVDVTPYMRTAPAPVVVQFDGEGRIAVQVRVQYFLPWDRIPPPREVPLQVRVRYDRTELALHDTVTCIVQVHNRTSRTARMVMVDVGIPPGFRVLTEDLTELVRQGTIARFDRTPRQVIFYIDRVPGNAHMQWRFRMRATMPVRARTGSVRVYEYYHPDRPDEAPPRWVVVKGESSGRDRMAGVGRVSNRR